MMRGTRFSNYALNRRLHTYVVARFPTTAWRIERSSLGGLNGSACQTDQRKKPKSVRDNTGIDQGFDWSVATNDSETEALFLEHELIGKDNRGDVQGKCSTRTWPRVHTAQEKISGGEADEEEHEWCNDQPDHFSKPGASRRLLTPLPRIRVHVTSRQQPSSSLRPEAQTPFVVS